MRTWRSRGHRLRTGTIVDASIIDAPSSTKNRRRDASDAQWYFGMKAHMAASDVTQAPRRRRARYRQAYLEKRPEHRDGAVQKPGRRRLWARASPKRRREAQGVDAGDGACLYVKLMTHERVAEVINTALQTKPPDLRISEIVDRPNWVVSCYLPRIVFE